MVGRAVELEAIDGALGELQDGHPGLLEIVGEPGIGKTRLLTELRLHAEELDYLVLAGSASELEVDLPFSVFVDALDEYVEGLERQRLDLLSHEARAELATVFPSLAARTTDARVGMEVERHRSHRAVKELLEVLARRQPFVLVLDDLHWSDPGSIELLSALLRRPPAGAVLIGFALRPRQVPERLLPAVERASRDGRLIELELAALTRAEADALLRATPAEVRDDIYEESGGNPFYLQQLLRGPERRMPVAGNTLALDGVDVPPAVAAALAEELTVLSPDARRALDGAAVAGDPFEPELAAAAADVPHSTLLTAIDELLALDLIRTTDVPRRFRFRHPLVRRAAYESTPGGWRLGSHERCAATLAERGAPAVVLAHHVEWSAQHGDLKAVGTLRAAGEAAQQRTPKSAARWFGAALRLLPTTGFTDVRVELLLARARAEAAAGHFADSHSTLLETMALLPPDATTIRARLTAQCARLDHLLLRRVEARERLEGALADVQDPQSSEAVSLMLSLAVESYYDVEPAAIYAWANRALAVRNLAPGLCAQALALRAEGAVLAGLGSVAGACLDEAGAFVDGLGDDELGGHLDALAHLSTAEFYFPRFEAAVQHVERALAIGRATGQADLFPNLYPVLATTLARCGRMHEATQVADTALEVARLLDNTHQVAWGLINRSYIALANGEFDLALATADEARELAKNLDGNLIGISAAYAFARALRATGNAEAAAHLIVEAGGGPALAKLAPVSRVPGLQTLSRCLLAMGRTAEAVQAAEAAADCADEIGLPVLLAYSEMTTAYVAFDAGEHRRAAELALSAVRRYAEIGDEYSATTARVLAGRALYGMGERDRAVAELERAAGTFGDWGATRLRDEVERELRKLGRHVHRRTGRGENDDGLSSLTKRELEVAVLITKGKSNPDIARELFLSPKTVESHIRNIFRKLGVTSRVEVAVAVHAKQPVAGDR